MILLVHPPVSKPCEPPPGIARLAGALKAQGVTYKLIDANIEGLLSLLDAPGTAPDTWTRRALRDRASNVAALRKWPAYSSADRYRRAVADLNRALAGAAPEGTVRIGLCNYDDRHLSPVRSGDLLKAAAHPEQNPFYPYFSRRLTGAIEQDSPALIGFSLNYLSQAVTAFAMIGFVKGRFPGIQTVLGGSLVTSWVRSPFWHNPFAGLVDHVVDGPGEKPLLALAGAPEDCAAGVEPDYGGLPLHLYLAPGMILPYSASDGCYWNRCSFCPERAEGNRFKALGRTLAKDQVQALVARHRPVLLHLLDNALSPALLETLAHNRPGAPWYGFTRFSDLLADYPSCVALRESGCVMLKLGLESGDREVLDRMRKGIDLPTVSRTLRNLRRAGIATYVYLLFGTPYETEAGARKTLEFVANHSDAIGFLNVAVFNLPLNSPDASALRTKPFYAGDLSLYTDFVHPSGWNRSQVRRFIDRELKRHPAVAPILTGDPPSFTSNHAPLFVLGKGGRYGTEG